MSIDRTAQQELSSAHRADESGHSLVIWTQQGTCSEYLLEVLAAAGSAEALEHNPFPEGGACGDVVTRWASDGDALALESGIAGFTRRARG